MQDPEITYNVLFSWKRLQKLEQDFFNTEPKTNACHNNCFFFFYAFFKDLRILKFKGSKHMPKYDATKSSGHLFFVWFVFHRFFFCFNISLKIRLISWENIDIPTQLLKSVMKG